jgi:hypothetical protein
VTPGCADSRSSGIYQYRQEQGAGHGEIGKSRTRSFPIAQQRLAAFFASVATLFILFAAIAAAAPWILSNTALRAEVAAQIRQRTGLNALSIGRAVLVVLPQPHISVDDVRLDGSSGALHIEVRYLKAYFRLAPLLAGKIEVSSTILGQPVMDIDFNGSPTSVESDGNGAAASSQAPLEPAGLGAAAFGAITIVDGSAQLKTKQLPSGISIGGLNLTVDWSSPGAAAIVTGQASIRQDSCARRLDCYSRASNARPAVAPKCQHRVSFFVIFSGGQFHCQTEMAIQRRASWCCAVAAGYSAGGWLRCAIAWPSKRF